jgi:hypothetical protein
MMWTGPASAELQRFNNIDNTPCVGKGYYHAQLPIAIAQRPFCNGDHSISEA